MRRRRTLIDDYLKAHDPRGAATRATSATAPAAPAALRQPRRASLRHMSLPALAAATTLAVIAAVALMPGRAPKGGSPFLSPEAAVAAAAADLEHDGILHWRYTRGGPTHRKRPWTQEQWIDLKTGAVATFTPNAWMTGRTSPRRSWYNGRRTTRVEWPASAFSDSNGRAVIMRTVRRRGEPIPEQDDPIAALRELLAAAGRGDAELSAAPDEGGVPVVRVREVKPHARVTIVTTTYFTRERTPRHLRTINEFRVEGGRRSDPVILRVLRWELLPRTEAYLAKVRPPHFDPAKFVERTQFLGPPKR